MSHDELIEVETYEIEPEPADETAPAVPPPRPSAAVRRRARERGGGSKLKVIVIVSVIIVAAILLAVLMFAKPTVNGINVYVNKDVEGIDGITVIIDLSTSGIGEIDDTAQLEIKFNNTVVYSRAVAVKGNGATINIEYTDFVVGNGEYEVFVTLGGSTGAGLVRDLMVVVETIDMVFTPSVDPLTHAFQNSEASHYDLVLYLYDRTGQESVGLDKPGTLSLTITNSDTEQVVLTEQAVAVQYDHTTTVTVPYTESGNYSYLIAYTNPLVKTGTKLKQLEITKTQFLNQFPKAQFEITNLNSLGMVPDQDTRLFYIDSTAQVNGSDSYDPDGTIVKWEWDFNWDDDSPFTVEGTGIATSYSYTRSGNYIIALRVTDRYGQTSIATNGLSVYDNNVIPPV